MKSHIITVVLMNKINEVFENIDNELLHLDNSNSKRDDIILEGINFGDRSNLKKFVTELHKDLENDFSQIANVIDKKIMSKI